MRAPAVVRWLTVATTLALTLFMVGSVVGQGLLSGPLAVSPSSMTTGGPPKKTDPASAVEKEMRTLAAALPRDEWRALSHMPDGEISRALAGTPYASVSPALVRATAGAFATAATFTTDNVLLSGPFLGFISGCAFGGITWGGVGCALVGAVSGYAALMALGAAGNANSVEFQFEMGEAAQLMNDFLATDGLIEVSESVLNSTFTAFAGMGDAAALAQLPNLTFNNYLDLNASSVAFQQATLVGNYAHLLSAGLASVDTSFIGGYGSGGAFSSSCSYGIQTSGWTQSWQLGCLASNTAFYQVIRAAVEASAVNNTGLVFAVGGHAWIECSGGTTAYLNLAGGGQQFHIVEDSAWHKVAPTFSSVWIFNLVGGGTCDILGDGILSVPNGSGGPTSQLSIVGCGYQVMPNATPCDPTNGNIATLKTGVNGAGTFAVFKTRGGSGQQSPTYHPTGIASAFFTEENGLMNTVVTNARTYWTFLHILGYTSQSQIPSNCVIPMPNLILPPQYDAGLATLTVNQSLSLYEAMMNGMATFFNTPLNSTNFCNGHPPFVVDNVAWDANVEVTGFIFTLPVAHQVLATKSTWTVTNASTGPTRLGNASSVGLRTDPTPFVVWPTVKTLYVPVGKTQEVPVDSPLATFVPANGTFYGLVGNGTAAGTHGFSNGTSSGVAGAALFISSCSVRNSTGFYHSVTTYCPLALSSIGNFSFNSSCFATSSNGNCGPTPVLFFSSVCGQTFPVWAQLVALWAGLTGTSSIGCIVAEALALISIIVILAVVFWVAGAIVGRRN